MMADAVDRVTPRCSATPERGAPGMRLRKVSTRNWGTDSEGALRERISVRTKCIMKGIVSITSWAQSSGVITVAAGGFITFHLIPTQQKRRSTGPGAKKPLDPQRPEKRMGPGWRQRPRTFAPQASVMAAGVRDAVGYEYTCLVDGNQLCDLGHATQTVWFYRGLSAMCSPNKVSTLGT